MGTRKELQSLFHEGQSLVKEPVHFCLVIVKQGMCHMLCEELHKLLK